MGVQVVEKIVQAAPVVETVVQQPVMQTVAPQIVQAAPVVETIAPTTYAAPLTQTIAAPAYAQPFVGAPMIGTNTIAAPIVGGYGAPVTTIAGGFGAPVVETVAPTTFGAPIIEAVAP